MTDLRKVARILRDLKVTQDFLRQYPLLATKVAAALERADGPKA
ncbi:MAG TPA: hypothetical protein VEU07_06055 [Candidatus Acidoferrum sp.]|nr:hypothetical protein [Candidatus Acidoferrum sp.]